MPPVAAKCTRCHRGVCPSCKAHERRMVFQSTISLLLEQVGQIQAALDGVTDRLFAMDEGLQGAFIVKQQRKWDLHTAVPTMIRREGVDTPSFQSVSPETTGRRRRRR